VVTHRVKHETKATQIKENKNTDSYSQLKLEYESPWKCMSGVATFTAVIDTCTSISNSMEQSPS